MKNKTINFQTHLKQSFKDLKFKKAWRESEAQYQLARILIAQRNKQKLSQSQLAKKAKTTQSAISHIETMQANPSLFLLKRIATALKKPLSLTINPS